jgi:hypothetical protein
MRAQHGMARQVDQCARLRRADPKHIALVLLPGHLCNVFAALARIERDQQRRLDVQRRSGQHPGHFLVRPGHIFAHAALALQLLQIPRPG